MKRPLVNDYASSSSSSDDGEHPPPDPKVSPLGTPASKKRKVLPALSSTFVPPVPIDNPSLHQGRLRTTPFTPGQWAAHIYVPLELSPSLAQTLHSLLAHAKARCPTLHSLIEVNEDTGERKKGGGGEELHVSLSRPIYLRAHQRDTLRRAVRDVVRSRPAFDVSFAQLAQLTNDERTRAFLVCEVGAGYDELRGLARAVEPVVRELRQEGYYDEPRFHASVGWALLRPSTNEDGGEGGGGGGGGGEGGEEFERIERFPEGMVDGLRVRYGGRVREEGVRVREVRVRVGREEVGFGLRE